MSSTYVFIANPHYYSLLRNQSTALGRMAVVKTLRQHATMILTDAIKRIPVEQPHIIAAHLAIGIELIWVLSDNDNAVRFWLTLPSHDHTPAEKEAADLLLSCVAAEELGDVPEFKNIRAGETNANQLRAASKRPRLGRRDPLRERVTAIMGKERKKGRSLDEVLHSWKTNKFDGLRLTCNSEKNDYVVDDENASEILLRRFTYRQFRTFFRKSILTG